MRILIGVNAYPATGDAARRQADAAAACRALSDVALVNVQFQDDVFDVDGFDALSALRLDSTTVSGRAGIRKPIASEVFTLLADAATERDCEYFVFLNSDVQPTPALVERLRRADRDAYALSRMDIDPDTGLNRSVETAGIDGFAMRPDWWRAERDRFRAYILGEPVWDNVYCAVTLCHADAVLLNRDALIRHEHHATEWRKTPFARYTQLLSALDAPYFAIWYAYWDRLRTLRDRSADADEELALQRDLFVWRPTPLGHAVQAGRSLKARLRYQLSQLGSTEAASGAR